MDVKMNTELEYSEISLYDRFFISKIKDEELNILKLKYLNGEDSLTLLFKKICERGTIEEMKFIMKYSKSQYIQKAEINDIPITFTISPLENGNYVYVALKNRNYKVADYLHSIGYRYNYLDDNFINLIIKDNSLKLDKIKWAISKGYETDYDTFEIALRTKVNTSIEELDILEYLKSIIYHIYPPIGLENISLNKVKWLYDNKLIRDDIILDQEVMDCSVEIINFLFSKGLNFTEKAIINVCHYYKLNADMVEWLHKNRGYRWDNTLQIIDIILNNHNNLDIVKKLLEWGYRPTEKSLTCRYSQIVKFLKDNYFDKTLCYSELVDPREIICMVCYEEMKPDSKVKSYICKHFVCEECFKRVKNCCICNRN